MAFREDGRSSKRRRFQQQPPQRVARRLASVALGVYVVYKQELLCTLRHGERETWAGENRKEDRTPEGGQTASPGERPSKSTLFLPLRFSCGRAGNPVLAHAKKTSTTTPPVHHLLQALAIRSRYDTAETYGELCGQGPHARRRRNKRPRVPSGVHTENRSVRRRMSTATRGPRSDDDEVASETKENAPGETLPRPLLTPHIRPRPRHRPRGCKSPSENLHPHAPMTDRAQGHQSPTPQP